MKKLAMTVVAGLALAVTAAPFKDGERVCFFGDSVTHWSYYTHPVNVFYYTRYPESDVRIWNCGTGGSTAGESMIAVEGDVLAKKPTHVVILFGMNDCGMTWYLPTASKWMLEHRGDLLKNFAKNLPALYEKVHVGAPEASFTFCTLVPWDDALKFKGKENEVGPVGVTAAEVGFCDVVRALHAKVGGSFVDYYTPMLAWNVGHQKTDPYASLSPDRIHPREPGGLFMAATFLRAQGGHRCVCDVTVDAAAATAVRSENATVGGLKRTDRGGVSFTLLEKSLPYPVDAKALAMADEIGFWDEFNRENLAVTGLADGNWTLVIDGSNAVLTASAAEWAKGVNLAKCATPMMKQAQLVNSRTCWRNGKELGLRDLWVDRNVLWRRLQQVNAASKRKIYTAEDVDDERVYKAFAKGYAEAYKGDKGDKASFVRMSKGWENRFKVMDEIEADHRMIRTLNRPKPHVFELKPEAK